MERAFMKHSDWPENLPHPYFVKASDTIIKLLEDITIKGVTISASGFYGPQGRVLRLPLAIPDMVKKFEAFSYEGNKITNFEMEGSAIAGLSALLGHDAATVCCIIANRHLLESQPDYQPYVKKLVELSLERLMRD
jgi:uridine phosphorylase